MSDQNERTGEKKVATKGLEEFVQGGKEVSRQMDDVVKIASTYRASSATRAAASSTQFKRK